jgi:hypothetical protein
VAGKKKIGTIHFHYYEYPDETWMVRVAVGKNDLPDPKENPRAYMKMGLMTAQLKSYTEQQMKALDTLLVGKEEMKIIMEHAEAKAKAKQADVDKLQKKLPFEEDTDG